MIELIVYREEHYYMGHTLVSMKALCTFAEDPNVECCLAGLLRYNKVSNSC